MWDFMNGMVGGMTNRFMPRRRNGMNTMTAMVLGASVGIAAWETIRRSRNATGGDLNASAANIADQVLQTID